ncbi:sensor histidine kinase [Cohnella hongkongensis]|uniref:histidine kinase n=1 Tax=Cohnella hongkongensis TaxID=178337 RepID=A0ABV9FFH4_9BACL
MAPASSFGETSPPESGWQPFQPKMIQDEQAYWIRIPLPDVQLDNPNLQIRNFANMKVYDQGKVRDEYVQSEADKRTKNGFSWRFVPLPAPLSDEVFTLVVYSKHFPVESRILLGDRADLVDRIFRQDIDNLILGSLLLFSSLIGVGLYASQRDSLYLYFALLAFSGGYGTLVCNHLFMLLWGSPLPGHFQDGFLPFGAYAFAGALSRLYPELAVRTLRVFKGLLLAYASLTFLCGLLRFDLYVQAIVGFAPLFLAILGVAYWVMRAAYRARRDAESVWILAGFLSLMTIAAIHMYRFSFFAYLPEEVKSLLRWMNRLPVDLLFWGLFAFVVCLIRVIVHRYTAMHRQLTEFNRSLEHAVQTRTAQLRERKEQLESAHESLGASLREQAEALAEAMRLEERHRITGSIHDTVGHTLSATIIQLEAAKRLISHDHSLAEEKLGAAQGLVRTGLEDIRRAVRMLREDDSFYDLAGSLGALFRDAEQSGGCVFRYEPLSLPTDLGTVQKRVVFQMLQQGIHLGTKRSADRPCEFRLDMQSDDESIRIRFVHLNAPKPPGAELEFGLNTVAERAATIGGQLSGENDSDGFALKLTLPLRSHDSFAMHTLG